MQCVLIEKFWTINGLLEDLVSHMTQNRMFAKKTASAQSREKETVLNNVELTFGKSKFRTTDSSLREVFSECKNAKCC